MYKPKEKRSWLSRGLGFPNLSLSLNGDLPNCVTSHKILGLIIDNNLSRDLHVKHMCSKLASIFGLMWRYRDVIDHEMKILMYNRILYHKWSIVSIYGDLSKHPHKWKKIFYLQKRDLRLIFSLDYTTPSSKL